MRYRERYKGTKFFQAEQFGLKSMLLSTAALLLASLKIFFFRIVPYLQLPPPFTYLLSWVWLWVYWWNKLSQETIQLISLNKSIAWKILWYFMPESDTLLDIQPNFIIQFCKSGEYLIIHSNLKKAHNLLVWNMQNQKEDGGTTP